MFLNQGLKAVLKSAKRGLSLAPGVGIHLIGKNLDTVPAQYVWNNAGSTSVTAETPVSKNNPVLVGSGATAHVDFNPSGTTQNQTIHVDGTFSLQTVFLLLQLGSHETYGGIFVDRHATDAFVLTHADPVDTIRCIGSTRVRVNGFERNNTDFIDYTVGIFAPQATWFVLMIQKSGSTALSRASAFAYDSNFSDRRSSISVRELIAYDRVLSDIEIVNNETYLLNKISFQPFDPASVGAIGWWAVRFGYDDAVGTLTDQIGSNDFTQSDSALRPTLRSADLNGQDIVRFRNDNSNEALKTGDFGLTHPVTFLVVFRHWNSGASNSNNTLMDGLNTDNTMRLFVNKNAIRINSGSSGDTLTFRPISVGTWYIAGGCWNGGSSFQFLNGNGVLDYEAGAVGSAIPLGITLGGLATVGRTSDCDVAELIIFNSVASNATLNYCGNELAKIYPTLNWVDIT